MGINSRITVLCVVGEGGHTTELCKLIDQFGPQYDFHYLMPKEDIMSRKKIKVSGTIHEITRPRYAPGKKAHYLYDPLLTIKAVFQITQVIWRSKPDVVLCNGPWIAVLTAIVAKLYGIRVTYFETGARIYSFSTTGKVMRYLANDFFVQWESLQSILPSAKFAGRLL